MKINALSPKLSLSIGSLKQIPLRSDIETFKNNLKTLLSKVEKHESEENKKNHVRDFLLATSRCFIIGFEESSRIGHYHPKCR